MLLSILLTIIYHLCRRYYLLHPHLYHPRSHLCRPHRQLPKHCYGDCRTLHCIDRHLCKPNHFFCKFSGQLNSFQYMHRWLILIVQLVQEGETSVELHVALLDDPTMSLGWWNIRVRDQSMLPDSSLIVCPHGILLQCILAGRETMRLHLFACKHLVATLVDPINSRKTIHRTNKLFTSGKDNIISIEWSSKRRRGFLGCFISLAHL